MKKIPRTSLRGIFKIARIIVNAALSISPESAPGFGMDLAIDVVGLEKRFDNVTAVAGVSFQVYRSELFGFLGPNGAGKTTTINMLTGLARPDAGTVRIENIDSTKKPKAIQHLIGVVPDESNLYPELTGLENLNFCAALYGMPKNARQTRARELLNDFGLGQAADRKFGGYSKGMKRKLTIAAGIIHQPPILFLDEPTTGIDVASARQIRGLIKQLNQSGCTVFLTTHYLEEAERLCDRIAFIVDGRIVRIDSVANLMQDFQGRNIIQFELNGDTSDVCSRLNKDFAHYACELISSTRLRLTSDRPMDLIPLIQFFKEEYIEVIEARKIGPSLEDVFVQITGLETEALNNGPARQGPGKGKGK
jgi:ABC-2 type transport system ATP-binding protein